MAVENAGEEKYRRPTWDDYFVVCERRYHQAKESEEMFKQAGIELEYKYHETQEYE